MPNETSCQEVEKPDLAITAAIRHPKPIGPAKKLTEKISARINAAAMMIQITQSISSIISFSAALVSIRGYAG